MEKVLSSGLEREGNVYKGETIDKNKEVDEDMPKSKKKKKSSPRRKVAKKKKSVRLSSSYKKGKKALRRLRSRN